MNKIKDCRIIIKDTEGRVLTNQIIKDEERERIIEEGMELMHVKRNDKCIDYTFIEHKYTGAIKDNIDNSEVLKVVNFVYESLEGISITKIVYDNIKKKYILDWICGNSVGDMELSIEELMNVIESEV